jgi:hypothetical protein
MVTKALNGQLRCQGTALVTTHAVGDDVELAQANAHATHTILVFCAHGSNFGQYAHLPLLT